MEIKPLVFQSYHHIKFLDIKKKNIEEYNSKSVSLSEIELKSILALLFSIRYHYPNITQQQIGMADDVVSERYPITNITSKFGHQIIENLDKDNQEWLNILQDKRYLLSKIFLDSELNDFVHMALIDYMAIRKIEYGKFFLNEWSKSIIDTTGYFFDAYSKDIISALESNSNKLQLIADKIYEVNSNLKVSESLILVFTLNEYFSKSNNSEVSYAITNYIVRDNIHELNQKRSIYRTTINDVLKIRWNLNKGRGGHKR
jgi:hypothetical protein